VSQTIKAHSESISSLSVDNIGLISASFDGKIRFWNHDQQHYFNQKFIRKSNLVDLPSPSLVCSMTVLFFSFFFN